MTEKTTQLRTLLGMERVPLLGAGVLAAIFLTLHLTIEPLLATFLVTILFGLFTGLILFGFLYVFLLVKNRSFWHNAVTDRDPMITRSIRAILVLDMAFYVVVLAWQIQNSLLM